MLSDQPILSFFFNDTATTEIYTLSLHDALPIYLRMADRLAGIVRQQILLGDIGDVFGLRIFREQIDRKSTRLNSSHSQISYAVFCLKKKTHAAIAFTRLCPL